MRVVTSENADFISHFDNNNQVQAEINNTSLKHMLIKNHVEANRVKIRRILNLEHNFSFCKSFEKITKYIGSHLTFETADLQDLIYTTYANGITVTINSLYLFVPKIIPSAKTQAVFNDSLPNVYTISFDSCYTEQKIANDGNEFQVDIGSAQHVISPKKLIAAHQTHDRIDVLNK